MLHAMESYIYSVLTHDVSYWDIYFKLIVKQYVCYNIEIDHPVFDRIELTIYHN